MPSIKVINDTIVPSPTDPYIDGLTPREAQVRAAFFILGFGAPLVGAVMALLVNEDWWRRKCYWSYQRLCVIWFISITAFTTIVYVFPGQTTRSTLVMAIVHILVEISIMSLLIGWTSSQGLWAVFFVGLVGFTMIFVLENIAYAYWFTAALGGIGDALMPMLLLYGQQPILAIGTLAHAAAALSIFGEVVHDFGIVKFNLVSFFAAWFHVGFIVAGLRLQRKPEKEYPSNPMKRRVPPKVLGALVGIALFQAIIASSFFTFFAPKLGM